MPQIRPCRSICRWWGDGIEVCIRDIAGGSDDERLMVDQLLPGAQCAMSTLDGALASGRDMNNINLLGAHLAHSYLNHSKLMGADLRRAELPGAMIDHSDLRGARMVGANLEGANLEGANLLGADIAGANFTGANLSGAKWIDGRRCAAESTGACM